MLLDRHQLFQLAAYANAYAAGNPPDEDDVRMFLRIAHDDASANARARFLAEVDEERWPQSAIEVRPWTSELVSGAPLIERAPWALVLLAGRDEADPANWSSPLAYIPEPGSEVYPAWEPFYRALARWDIAALEERSTAVGWRPPAAPDAPVAYTRDSLTAPEQPWWRRHANALQAGAAALVALAGGALLYRATTAPENVRTEG